MTVRTRIAPSPTGIAHIGTAYMALFNYAFAKKHGGEFLVRIEDTDRNRFVEGAEAVIYDALAWLEIPYRRTFRQSERLSVYAQMVQQLIDHGHAYYCFCSPDRLELMRLEQQKRKLIPRYDRQCLHLTTEEIETKLQAGERHVIRMKMPDDEIVSWDDLIRGRVEINTKELDDQVLMKSDGFPTYHLAVVVDDQEMEITHVIRGEEWISSTPKHILLYRYFGWQQPEYAHMPLLRNPDKTKMSKRKNDVSIPSYQEKGYLASALRNYLCLLGWSHPEEKDIFGLDEFVDKFSFDRMVKSGPIFDVQKLQWMNGKYIREHHSESELIELLGPYLPIGYPVGLLPKVLPLVKDRLVTLSEIGELTDFFYKRVHPQLEQLVSKKATKEDVHRFLTEALAVLASREDERWIAKEMEAELLGVCDARGWNRGAFFMSVRVAVSGRTATPPLFDMIEVIGKATTLERLQAALDLVRSSTDRVE